MSKNSFSIIELMLVMLILVVVYALTLPKITITEEKEIPMTLETLKEYLLKQEFQNSLSLKCIDKTNYPCYLFIDDQWQEETHIDRLFFEEPEVYSFDQSMERVEFDYVSLDTFEDHRIVFELNFDEFRRHSNWVVKTYNTVYVFNPLFLKPLTYETLNDVESYRDDLIGEVKGAF